MDEPLANREVVVERGDGDADRKAPIYEGIEYGEASVMSFPSVYD